MDPRGERLAALERRIEVLEDEMEIRRLIASYGPAVDSNSREAAARMWTEEGLYDVDIGSWSGRAEISAMLAGEFHQDCLVHGCAHLASVSVISLDGDSAVATGYLQLIVRSGDEFEIRRQTAQRWELVRTDEGWKIQKRIGRLIDGSREPRDMLESGLSS